MKTNEMGVTRSKCMGDEKYTHNEQENARAIIGVDWRMIIKWLLNGLPV